jgi:hypothetical protein
MKWLHNLLKGASLTTALFVFQACYGSPESYLEREGGYAPMTFSVLSRTTGEPLEGIHVLGQQTNAGYHNYIDLGVTASDGTCKVNIPYVRNIQGPYVRFEDPAGAHEAKDTVLFDLRERDIIVKLNDAL